MTRYEANATCASEGGTLVQVDNEFLAYYLGDRFRDIGVVRTRLEIPHFWVDSKIDVT